MDKIVSQNKSRLCFLENAVFSINNNIVNLKTQINNIITNIDDISDKKQSHNEFVRQKKGVYYVSPSQMSEEGGVMSITKRRELLAKAQENDYLII